MAWTWPNPCLAPGDDPRLGEYFCLMDISPHEELICYHYHILQGDPECTTEGPVKLFAEKPGGGFFSEKQVWASEEVMTSEVERTAVTRALARAGKLQRPPALAPRPERWTEPPPPPSPAGDSRGSGEVPPPPSRPEPGPGGGGAVGGPRVDGSGR